METKNIKETKQCRTTIKNNKGFTLVELIVVIVILAILAAILVPALLGYIDKAKESQNMLKAKNMLQATQTVLTEYYAKDEPLTYGYDTTNSEFGKKVRKVADDDPYMVIIGVGTNGEQKGKEGYGESKHDQYTAYFVAYWQDKDTQPLFFDGKEWSVNYPWAKGESGAGSNYFYVNGKKMNLSFMFVANKSKEKNPWIEIQKAVEKFGNSYSAAGKTKK